MRVTVNSLFPLANLWLSDSRLNWNWECWFLRRGEHWRTRRKTSRSKDENQQQTQPTYDAKSGYRTQEESAPTTTPSLLPPLFAWFVMFKVDHSVCFFAASDINAPASAQANKTFLPWETHLFTRLLKYGKHLFCSVQALDL